MRLLRWEGEFTLERVRSHWNSVSSQYDDWNSRYDTTHFQRFEESMKYIDLSPGMRVLDVWSRTGNASHYLCKQCQDIEYVGLELAEELLRLAKKKYETRQFIHGSMCELPISSATFDRIISLETLEHIPKPYRFLSELRRVIKPSGKLVMSTPPATAEWMTSLVDALKLNHGEGPRRFLSSREVKTLLEQSGFRLLLHRGTVLIPVGPLFLRRWGLEWLDNKVQASFLSEFGIRQFYICEVA